MNPWPQESKLHANAQRHATGGGPFLPGDQNGVNINGSLACPANTGGSSISPGTLRLREVDSKSLLNKQ